MVKVYRKSQPGVSRFDNSANVSVVSSRNEKKWQFFMIYFTTHSSKCDFQFSPFI